MWGKDARPEKVNFCWPTEELLSQMPANVTLKRLEFMKVREDSLSFVCCTLSNGATSGPIEGEGVNSHASPKVIQFDPRRPIRSVVAFDNNSNNVCRLRFLDRTGNEIHSYNPNNDPKRGAMHEIHENEELIGVYGVKGDNYKWFRNFGFIVKVRL